MKTTKLRLAHLITGLFAFAPIAISGIVMAQSMSDLGTLGGSNSAANAVSADGSVIVGEASLANGDQRAFKYVGSVMQDLGTLGGSNSYAYGVSADGSVIVGYSQTAGVEAYAFKYVGGVMQSLGSLGGGKRV